MHRIDTPNRALALYGAGKDGWRDGVMSSGILPTEVNAAFMNTLQEEIAGVIEGAGQVLNPGANNQLLIAIENLIEVRAGNYLLDTGVANAYVVAMNPAPPARQNGQVIRFKIAHANTGASTVNDGFGIVSLLNDVAGALVLGDLPLGSVAVAVFDAVAGAYLMAMLVPSQALTQTQGDGRYAALAGLATQLFSVAAATASAHAVNLGQFTGSNQSLATNGYQKLPGGLIIQWGTTAGIASSVSSGTLSYPIAFPNAAIYVNLMGVGAVTSGANTNLALATKTATNFSFVNSYLSSDPFNWLAIGY